MLSRNLLKLLVLSTAFSVFCTGFMKTEVNVRNNVQTYYIINIAWTHNSFEDFSVFWLLEPTDYLPDTTFGIKIKNSNFDIISFLPPHFSFEFLFCCEKRNVIYMHDKDSKQIIDSLGEKYEKEYSLIYKSKGLPFTVNRNNLFILKRTINGYPCKINISKIKADICKCRALSNYKGSSFTDTIANIKTIQGFVKMTGNEKKMFRENIDRILKNRLINEALPNKISSFNRFTKNTNLNR